MATGKGITPEAYLSITLFMYHEAQLLDDHQWGAWGELLSEDIDYRVPVRLTSHWGPSPSSSCTSSTRAAVPSVTPS